MLILFADSDMDVTPEIAEQYGYNVISMPYSIDGQMVYPYVDFDKFEAKEFYDKLRSGIVPKTSGLSPEEYKNYFEPHLAAGNDILYLHFSSALSGTFDVMNIAVNELKEKYPDRTVYSIDTKAISVASLNMAMEVGELYKQGKTAQEIVKWAETEVDKFALYLYADDLKFFARSGRVSNFSASMGSIIGIHPIIYIDGEGRMLSIAKVQGKKASLRRIVDYIEDLQDNIKDHKIIIGHADAVETATTLGKMIAERIGDGLTIEYVEVNPTAGSHCGPGAVGVSFHAVHR